MELIRLRSELFATADAVLAFWNAWVATRRQSGQVGNAAREPGGPWGTVSHPSVAQGIRSKVRGWHGSVVRHALSVAVQILP
jgi:hypothetical protein